MVVFFICRRPKLKLEEAELIALKPIQKFVENENYLVSWDLRKICNDCREYTLMLPYTIKELHYGGFVDFGTHGDCKEFLKLENLVNIENLVIYNNTFLHLSSFNFPKLRKLKTCQGSHYPGNAPIHAKAIYLPQLKHLNLDCWVSRDIEFYKPLFSRNLEILSLHTSIGVTDDLLSHILNECFTLRELIIVFSQYAPTTTISGSLLDSMVKLLPCLTILFSKFLKFDVVLSS